MVDLLLACAALVAAIAALVQQYRNGRKIAAARRLAADWRTSGAQRKEAGREEAGWFEYFAYYLERTLNGAGPTR